MARGLNGERVGVWGSLELLSFFVPCVALAEGVLDGPTKAGWDKKSSKCIVYKSNLSKRCSLALHDMCT